MLVLLLFYYLNFVEEDVELCPSERYWPWWWPVIGSAAAESGVWSGPQAPTNAAVGAWELSESAQIETERICRFKCYVFIEEERPLTTVVTKKTVGVSFKRLSLNLFMTCLRFKIGLCFGLENMGFCLPQKQHWHTSLWATPNIGRNIGRVPCSFYSPEFYHRLVLSVSQDSTISINNFRFA